MDIVSIITPMFNSECYIKDYIDSVLNQTYDNIELLLVDDCSRDATVDICKKISRLDNRVKLVCLQSNQGASVARNIGLSNASGKYITFADSDDYMPNEAIQKLINAILVSKADIIFGNLKVVSSDNVGSVRLFPKGKRCFNNREAVSSYLNFWILYGAVCGKLYRRECIEDVHFPEDMKIGEDGVFCARAISNARKIIVIDEIVYEYRQRCDSASSRGKFSYKELVDRILQKEYVEKAFYGKMQKKDFQVFVFELYRVVRYWEKYYRLELLGHYDEYMELKNFCNKNWFNVFLNSYNVRIKVRAIKYFLGII